MSDQGELLFNNLVITSVDKGAIRGPLHISTYNILMKVEANEHNIEG